MNNKINELKKLNDTLKLPDELGGVFLPKEAKERFDIMFMAEMPSMSEPKDRKVRSYNFNFDITKRDKFFQKMMEKYDVAGCYVTDIVKERAKPGMPVKDKILYWRHFLLEEIKIITPKAIVVLGLRTYKKSFKPFIEQFISKNIKVDYVYHYSNQVRHKIFEQKFAEVIGKI
ncbi:MAG: uracil-DNA glycosylase family protein, partial [Thermoguttaceae bacterium]